MRILILSHGHPELSMGGAERAAYSLFQRLKRDPGVEKAVFVARAEPQAIGHSAFFGSFRGRPDEILVSPPQVDGFTFQTLGYDVLKQLVGELISSIRPDVVHVHHFVFWGIEIFEMFKRAGVKVVFTIHEFAAICANFGQMVKVDGRLCHAASPAECGMCFPTMSAGKFFVRNTILKSLFADVDYFVSPSAFLKGRYAAWGIDDERIGVIENLLDPDVIARGRLRVSTGVIPAQSGETGGGGRVVIGYFGQINPFKGVDLLLQATAMLPESLRLRLEIRIHGENRHFKDTAFGARIDSLLADTEDVVRLMGSYRNEDVSDLMAACAFVIVPSVWWENSPVVIQEAKMAGRPLICANIGGMAEKMNAATDHLFTAKSPGALAEVLRRILERDTPVAPTTLNHLALARADVDEDYFDEHSAVYRRLLDANALSLVPAPVTAAFGQVNVDDSAPYGNSVATVTVKRKARQPRG
ncbi:glycosyltransferase family 4 protein [Microvirga antarctica]|uniref:glycosyltransferase family 4 protein n=1 Tax=Microvirga antarctica TaxID=2819233 RepID=UPI001B310710|nr:glycosyltransferase family 4 protein [Microvirga antarctica]